MVCFVEIGIQRGQVNRMYKYTIPPESFPGAIPRLELFYLANAAVF